MDPRQELSQDELFHEDQDAWESDVVREATEYWEELGTLEKRKKAYEWDLSGMVSVSREREQALLIMKELFEDWGVWEEEEEEEEEEEGDGEEVEEMEE